MDRPMTIFLSYARKDEENPTFRTLQDLLARNRFDVWKDKEKIRPGQFAFSLIHKAIDESICCVFYFSNQSCRSTWCAAEVAAFWGKGKPILVLREHSR